MARILVLSLVLVLALLGATVAREVKAFRESGDAVHAVSLALAVQDLVQQAQRERGLSNGLLGGDIRLVQAVSDQRVVTDRTMRALAEAAAGNTPGAGQVRSAIGQFDGLDATRTQIDARRTSRQAAFQFYTDGISALNRLTLGLDQARDAEVRHGLEALYALGDAKEQTAKERGFLNGVFAADEFRNGEYVEFLDIRAAKMAGLTAFARDATAAQQARLDAALRSENAVKAGESEQIAIASSTGPLVRSVDPSTWWAQMTAVIDEQRAVQQAVGDDVQRRAEALRRDAFLTLGGYLLAALIAIAAEVALVVASVRAIVRPLGALAAEADDVANHRLPEVIAAWQASGDTHPDPPAPVRTPRGASAEIAAVAGALDGVQTTAFELASQQALVRRNTTESMANLARRNQNLVRRQLGLISEFEREELDPKGLSNLFELDHLATRMRRNAESLLVLVGAASPRRWAEPIALTDVIRAGLSEVDDYRRVVLRRVDDIAITGAVVSELAHMLAELIENGLAFSPPDMEVEIYGRKLPNGYLLAVVDHGIGMPVEQLEEANARLSGETDFVVAPMRYLGHYVVGQLARRLGIDVELNVSPVSGIVARLLLPVGIIAGEKDRRAPGERGEVVPGMQGHTESAALVDASGGSLAGEKDRRASAAEGSLPAGAESGVQGHAAEPTVGFVGASEGSSAGEAVSARPVLDAPRRGAPVDGAPVDGAQIESGQLYGAQIDGAQLYGGRIDSALINDARVDGAPLNSASVPGAHGKRVTGGSEADGAAPQRQRSGGPAHARPGHPSPTPAPAPFAHFHSAPDDFGDDVVSIGSDVDRAVTRGDRAASEVIPTGDRASYGAIPTGDRSASGSIPTGDRSASGINGSLTGLPRGNGAGSDGASGSMTGLPAVNRSGTGRLAASGSLTGLPAANGSGSDRRFEPVPATDRPTDAGPATGGPRPAARSSVSSSLWPLPETATTTAESDSAPAGVQRTKNGLIKRNKRARAGGIGSNSAPRDLTPAPPSAPAVERSPAEIRSMLSSFRAGHERGAPDPPQPEASENIPRATDLAQTPASPPTAEEIR
ncbi:nitrate- and nitrite sensing domain-containing protein [Nocardia sp. CA-119907]|uniref:nitrate- and nitrite sensing domain-containing protein n=1 Tax=Nocardia sp. CA-119907 TaxID=3239973 RepID=UPI003D9584FD